MTIGLNIEWYSDKEYKRNLKVRASNAEARAFNLENPVNSILRAWTVHQR